MDTPQGHPALESVMLLIVADLCQSLPFSTAWPQFRPACPSGRRAAKLLTVADFVYELCHIKRRVNADELARIT